jgi:hypothetical protein
VNIVNSIVGPCVKDMCGKFTRGLLKTITPSLNELSTILRPTKIKSWLLTSPLDSYFGAIEYSCGLIFKVPKDANYLR